MILKIIKDESHPILHETAKPIEEVNDHLKSLIKNMKETLKEQADPEGVGLSSNQVGYDLSLAVIRLPLGESNHLGRAQADEYMVLINPKIIESSQEEAEEIEGCLSVPGKWGRVRRAKTVKVQAQGVDGKNFTLKAAGFLARILQHEIDHLNGVLFKEKVDGKILTEEELGEELKENPKFEARNSKQ